jgi:quinol monooxygenase YgiN
MTHILTLTKTGLLNPFMNRKLSKASVKNARALNIPKWVILIIASGFMSMFSSGYASAQEKVTIVRLAKLRIDSTQIESYKAALKEEIETSVRVEPGVLSLYAISEKDYPDHITIFEIYADADAYNAHRETPHFKKYKSVTKEMVKSLELIEAVPILLGSKTEN